MNSAFVKVTCGQILLVICCIFYLIWWSISYRPGVAVNRAGGINGVLLLITALSGLSGVVLSIIGENALPAVSTLKMGAGMIVTGGILAYIILLIVTRFAFQRPVTTELILITGWAVLELTVISSLNAAGRMTGGGFWLMICVIAAAVIISLVMYVLYYRMEEMRAFHAAMIPLVTEGISMIALLITATAG